LAVACASLLSIAGCAPRARPLSGTPTPARLPTAEMPPGHRRIVFRWRYSEGEFDVRGDGLARVAAPDSVRLDLFVSGGLGGGHAFLLGDSVFAEGGDAVKRVLPPPPLMWASLGRLRVPSASDTTARVDGDTLRADIGRDPTWRVAFAGTRLVGLQRLSDGRIVERVTVGSSEIRYENSAAHRMLVLNVTRTEEAAPFDETIWSR
jgi:hypothetical protein